jgi:hypothetical protein
MRQTQGISVVIETWKEIVHDSFRYQFNAASGDDSTQVQVLG